MNTIDEWVAWCDAKLRRRAEAAGYEYDGSFWLDKANQTQRSPQSRIWCIFLACSSFDPFVMAESCGIEPGEWYRRSWLYGQRSSCD